MKDIERVLRATARRLFLIGLLRALVLTGTVATSALLLLVAAEKLGPWTFPWRTVFGVAIGAVVLASLLIAAARRPRGLALADELDRRAGLRETVSTSVLIGEKGDAWSRAVTASASARVRRVVLRDAIPVRAPGGWRVPVALLALAVLALRFAPRHDLSGLLDRRAEVQTEQAEVRAVALEIRSQEKQLEESLAKAGVQLTDESGDDDPAGNDKPKSVDEIKRAALKKLTRISDELNKMKQGDKARQLQAMKRALKKLRSPGPGPMNEFSRNLARGDFADAKKALSKVAESIKSGEMSEEERTRAAEQLRKLAEQMDALAAQRDALRNALEQAGMDPQQAAQLASDPDSLGEALEQMQGLSAEQMQSLLNRAMSQRAASDAMQSMAGSMSRLAQAMKNGSMQNMEPMQMLNQQLSSAEMMQAEMRAVDEAMGQCRGQMQQLGESMCNKPGYGNGFFMSCAGNGVGPGIGAGDGGSMYDPDAAPADDYILKSEKTAVRNLGGPVIGSTLVYGAQVKGEAKARFDEVARASAKRAAEAIESMQVPREYRDAVRHYFGRFETIAGKQGKKPAEPNQD